MQQIQVMSGNPGLVFQYDFSSLKPKRADLAFMASSTLYSQLLTEGNFSTNNDWTVTGDWDAAFTGNSAVWEYTTGQTSTLTQAITGLVPGFEYIFGYQVTEDTIPNGTVTVTASLGSDSQDLVYTKYAKPITFTATETSPDFTIAVTASGSSAGKLTFDNFYLYQKKSVYNGDIRPKYAYIQGRVDGDAASYFYGWDSIINGTTVGPYYVSSGDKVGIYVVSSSIVILEGYSEIENVLFAHWNTSHPKLYVVIEY